MANQLGMDKSLVIEHFRQQGMSQRCIARAFEVSRGAVIRHLQAKPMIRSISEYGAFIKARFKEDVDHGVRWIKRSAKEVAALRIGWVVGNQIT